MNDSMGESPTPSEAVDPSLEPAPWLSEDEPLEPEEHAAQLDALFRLLGLSRRADGERGPTPPRVLELGCGTGRIARPLADEGCDVTGIDRRADALAACAKRREGRPDRLHLHAGEFLGGPWPEGPFDAVLCLGNTLMEVVEMESARRLFKRVAEALRPGGAFIIDDIPGMHWPRLAEGDWQEGVSEEGDVQMVWSDRDAVFALRTPPADLSSPEAWRLLPSDRRFRLYTDAVLELLASGAGLSAPRAEGGAPVLVMRRPKAG